MRKDMAKVIVERPRRGSVKRARKGRTRALQDEAGDELRARAPAKRAEKTKSLNENLAPLRRFLESQVGRPWDKVYSEISEHLRPSNAVQQHVRDHIEDFVATKTRMKDGKVVVTNGRFPGRVEPLTESWQKLYVHPRTGLLRKNEHWRNWTTRQREQKARLAAEREARFRALDPRTQLHKLNDGAWYEVKLAKIERVDGRAKPYADAVTAAKLSDLAPALLYEKDGVYAARIAKLSKADMKGYGLPIPKATKPRARRAV